jgi:Fic family protein
MATIPYVLTPKILKLSTEIERIIGQFEGIHAVRTSPKLRKENRIRTIQSSLAIEGNTLTSEQVTNILEGKKVIGPKRDILEVQNANLAYAKLLNWKPLDLKSFLSAHACMMKGLIPEAGKWRNSNVGIFQGTKVTHVAPKAALVPKLMGNLFFELKNDHDIHPLVRPSLCHYEIEFIHPFSDGNGRMGCLWQSVFLAKYHPIFEFIPVETLIAEHQSDYYKHLALADKLGSAEPFLEFSLTLILSSLQENLGTYRREPLTTPDRLEIAKQHFSTKYFSRLEYLELLKTISSATASRDLRDGVKFKFLNKEGDKRLARYSFNKNIKK